MASNRLHPSPRAESTEVLVKMIADDDEAEVTEADAMRFIDMINA